MDERELGLLSGYSMGNFLRNESQEAREVKIERQAGQPDKQTITSSYQPQENTLGPVGEFLSGIEAKARAFDPLEWWDSISSAVDAEFDKGTSQPVGPSGAPAPSSGFSQDVGLNGPMNGGGGSDVMPVNAPPAPSSGFSQDMGGEPQMPAFTEYDMMAGTDPSGGVMQEGSASSWLPTYSSPGNPQSGFEPFYGQDVTPSGVGEFDGIYQSGDQMVTDQMNPQQVEEAAGTANSLGMLDDPEWVDIQDQAGVPKASQQQTQAALDEVKATVPTSNNMSGRDLTSDPIMRNYNPDPAQRHADYIKQMNMIMMGGMLLDLAASALGVRSNSGRYMDTQMKILESQMKFDDQQRIDDAVNAVYYPDGEYANPGSQADVFEALMKTGLVKPAEASAISGYHPDQASYKEIYRVGPDGKVETKQVRKDEMTPDGWTDSSGVATVNAGLDADADPTKATGAQKNLMQIQEFEKLIADAEAKGDVLEANKLRSNLSDFKRLSGAAGTKGQNTISQATTTFNAIYPASTKDTGTFQKEDGSNYPWDEYFNDWKQSWFVTVMENGEKRQKPGFLTLIDREPAVASTNTALSNAIEILRTDVAKGSEWANASVIAFVKRYGSENLPADLRGLLPDE